MYILSNNAVSISFDKTTGAVTALKNLKTGYSLLRQPALAMGLFMLVPTGSARNNRVLSENQRLTAFTPGADRQSALLRYDRVMGSHSGCLDIAVSIAVRLNGPSLSFQVEIENRSVYTVEEAGYPCLGGIGAPEADTPLVARSLQFQGGLKSLRLGDGFSNGDYWGTDWPTLRWNYPTPETAAPFMLLDGGGEGLYIGVHQNKMQFASFLFEYKPGYGDGKHHRLLRDGEIPGVPAGFCLSVRQLPFAAPEETLSLAPVVLQFYEGDWHKGMRPYQDWRDTWFKPVARPVWLDTADCWMTLHINSPEGCRRHRYKALPGLLAGAREQGVQVLQLIGWARGGQDGDEPYQDVDPLLGTKEELKEAIAQIEGMGIRVLLMCKFKWADQSTPEYQEELLPHTMKDLYGWPVQFGGYAYQNTLQSVNGGSRRAGAGLCHLSKGYREIALRELHKILDLAPSGILYDELANPLLLCFDKSHGHRPGECIQVGTVTLSRQFYEAATARLGTEFLMGGEGPSDVLCQYYWGNYVRTDDGSMGTKDHVPAWKYLFPDTHIATCLVGFDDREMVNQCVTFGYAMNYEIYNFKGLPKDAPLTARAVKEAQALRGRLREYLWTGTFRHTEGVTLLTGDDACPRIYSLFVSKKNGKRAVVVANQSAEESLRVQVVLEGAREYSLYRPGTEEVLVTGGDATLAPRSFAVLVEK